METHGGNSATRATDLANGAVTSVTRETSSVCTIGLDLPDWPGHRAGQHVDVRLTAEDGYTAEREYSIASAPGEPLAITVERWWGLEATAYLYIAFVAVLSVIAAVHAGRPQAHQRRAIRDLRGREPAPRAPRADPHNHPIPTNVLERIRLPRRGRYRTGPCRGERVRLIVRPLGTIFRWRIGGGKGQRPACRVAVWQGMAIGGMHRHAWH
jgi:hypothetical protein